MSALNALPAGRVELPRLATRTYTPIIPERWDWVLCTRCGSPVLDTTDLKFRRRHDNLHAAVDWAVKDGDAS